MGIIDGLTAMRLEFLSNNKRKYYFSEQQKKRAIHNYNNAPPEIRWQLCPPIASYVLLDNGQIEEYTESRNAFEEYHLGPHSKNFPDSIYLGIGETVNKSKVDNFINKLEAQIKHEG